jgi:hypothetical protein
MRHARALAGLAGKIALVRNTNHLVHQSEGSRDLSGSGQQRNNAAHSRNYAFL